MRRPGRLFAGLLKAAVLCFHDVLSLGLLPVGSGDDGDLEPVSFTGKGAGPPTLCSFPKGELKVPWRKMASTLLGSFVPELGVLPGGRVQIPRAQVVTQARQSPGSGQPCLQTGRAARGGSPLAPG